MLKNIINGKLKKIVISILLIFVLFGLLNEAGISSVHTCSIGGKLLTPIGQFISVIADIPLYIGQKELMGDDTFYGIVEESERIYNQNYSMFSIFADQVPALSADFFFANNGKYKKYEMVESSNDYIKWGSKALIENKDDLIEFVKVYLRGTNKYTNYADSVTFDGEVFTMNYQDYEWKNEEYWTYNFYVKCKNNNGDEKKLKGIVVSSDKWANGARMGLYRKVRVDDSLVIANNLKSTISSTYKSIRNLAISIFLIVLIYIGIRIVISSAAKDKAKYKAMLIDWIVGLCILFTLTMMMSGITFMTNKLTSFLAASCSEDEANFTNNMRSFLALPGVYGDDDEYTTDDAQKYVTSGLDAVMYLVLYIMMAVLTIIFTFKYLKRLVYIAFLTAISPLIALTYPLDKVGDGTAQGFNYWLREYVFNMLIQPLHLLLYMILIGSAAAIYQEYPLYAIVCLAFITQAEKILRKMFNFEKASTVSPAGGAAGAALMMGGIQKMAGMMSGRNKGKGMPSGNSKGGLPESNTESNEVFNPIKEVPDISGDKDGAVVPETDMTMGTAETAGGASLLNESLNSKETDGSKNGNTQKLTGDQNRKLTDIQKDLKGINDSSNKLPGTDINAGENQTSMNNQKGFKNKAKRKLNNLKTGAGAIARYQGRRFYGNITNKQKRRNLGRKLGRGVIKTAGAIGGGALGIGIGAATGDPSKVLSYGAAGAVGGSALTSGISQKASNILDIEGSRNVYENAIDKDESAYWEKKKKENRMSAENYSSAVKNLGVEDAKEFLKEGGVADRCIEAGITDINEQQRIYQTTQELKDNKKLMKNVNQEETDPTEVALMAYNFDKKFGDIKYDTKKRENFEKVFEDKGYNKQQTKEFEKLMTTYQKTEKRKPRTK